MRLNTVVNCENKWTNPWTLHFSHNSAAQANEIVCEIMRALNIFQVATTTKHLFAGQRRSAEPFPVISRADSPQYQPLNCNTALSEGLSHLSIVSWALVAD